MSQLARCQHCASVCVQLQIGEDLMQLMAASMHAFLRISERWYLGREAPTDWGVLVRGVHGVWAASRKRQASYSESLGGQWEKAG